MMVETPMIHDDIAAMLLVKKELEQLQSENISASIPQMTLLGIQAEQSREHAHTLAEENDYYRKKLASQLQELQNAQADTARMEQRLCTREEEMGALQEEVKSLQRHKRDTEKQAEKETKLFEGERSAWAEKEAALQDQLRTVQRQLLKAQTAQQQQSASIREEDAARARTQDVNENQRALMIAQRTIREQDKLILELREKIDQEKEGAESVLEQYQVQSLKIAHLENEIHQLNRMKESLQEDNESYQILLQEKTLSGEFTLDGLTGAPPTPGMGFDLAAELTRASAPSSPSLLPVPDPNREKQLEDKIKLLKSEIKSLKDENKALVLYINKILARVMENNQLENILARDYDASKKEREVAEAAEAVVRSAAPPRRRSSLQVTPDMLAPNNKAGGARGFVFGRKASDATEQVPKSAGLMSTMPRLPTAGPPPSASETRGYAKRWRRHQSMSMPRSKALEEIAEATASADKKKALPTVDNAAKDASTVSGDETAVAAPSGGGIRRAFRRMSLLGSWKTGAEKAAEVDSAPPSATASSSRSTNDSIPEEEE
ncbi:hypothetical protein THASP1DRAFT_29436 [Thamnocephalis sphaerospora]|uniref:Uncharacterized protein n=1 Tax=Thamnocephalis sphaerospora TaxID=78915 RepID=A0A4P9XRP3_9FUNG|nr:hypothetical protein THASP1DRAFT_29436 [Thamnocephalis sphaerospora]|eukprot:RKP08767.1 hypothetical protein THASP1DRAFT_29436 [Thamnocephalis sphaerospora]